ncbi:ankyrin-1-like isoform X2 [Macrobrachium nipponense]|uniref:ankyrin-1-like isoform X2 n=1 Tax=Macrobrachium nipponense TaxID=159736 RepID=UPI0030C8AAAD
MGDTTAQLLAAIMERDEVGVLRALENGANANFSGRLGGRPLHTAAYDRDSEDVIIIVDHLLKHNAEINAQNNQGFTPLMVASLNGHEGIVRKLLHYDADIEIIRGTSGERALHLAMNKNGSGTATALLDAGADMNAQTSEDNSTPLHLAAEFGNSLSAEALINHPTFERETLQAKNKGGETPAEVATREGHHELACRLNLIEAAETDIDKRMITALLSGKVEDLESALNDGGDVNKSTSKYVTPLHVAAAKGSLSLVQVLLNRQATNVEAVDNDGYTPLMVASLRGHIDVVEKLIAFRAKPNNESHEGETALHLAVIHDNQSVVRSLLDNGASINKRTKDGSTPLHLAAKYNAIRSAEELVKDISCKKDERNANGYTPLEIAKKRGHRQLCSILNAEDEAEADVYESQFQEVIKPKVIYGEIKQPSGKIYKNTSHPRGKVLIVNNIFEGKNFRQGAKSDTVYLTDLFKKMGYEVQCEENLTKEATLNVLENFRDEEKLKKIDSALFFFLSHGSKGKFLTSDYKSLEESEVQEFFKNKKGCLSLEGKPRVFVFNFCRGEFYEERTLAHFEKDSKAMGHTDEEGRAPEVKSSNNKNTTDAPKDMLFIYASTDGIRTLRHPTFGTFFIKTLCQIFAKFAHKYDIESMTKIICNQMERGYLTTPEMCNYHFKTFFLNPAPESGL